MLGHSPTENVKAWTDDETKRALELHRSGMTFFQVAEELGRTRNSIAGRLHRVYGVTGDGQGSGRHRRRSKPRKPRQFVPAVSRLPEPAPLLLSTDDLCSNTCRQPYGESSYRFCGHPVQEGSSYCPYHHEINWVPAKNSWQKLGDVAARIAARARVQE